MAANTPAAAVPGLSRIKGRINPFLGSSSNAISRGGTGRTGNPFLSDEEFDDPTLTQSFSGPGAGFAQFGQLMAQQGASAKKKAQFGEDLDVLQEKLQGAGDNWATAFGQLAKENPRAFLSLSKSGILDNMEKLQLFANADKNQAGAGMKTVDLPNGNKGVVITQPNGNQTIHELRPNEKAGDLVVGHKADTGEMVIVNKTKPDEVPMLVPGVNPGNREPREPNAPKGQPVRDKNGNFIGWATPEGFTKPPADMPTGARIGGPAPPMSQRDRDEIQTLSNLMPSLVGMRQNVGATGVVNGIVDLIAAKKGGVGSQSVPFFTNLSQAQAMIQGIGPTSRLKMSAQAMEGLLPNPNNSTAYNTEGLKAVQMLGRTNIAHLAAEYKAKGMEMPEDLQALVKTYNADPDVMAKLSEATNLVQTNPAALDKTHMSALFANRKDLPNDIGKAAVQAMIAGNPTTGIQPLPPDVAQKLQAEYDLPVTAPIPPVGGTGPTASPAGAPGTP